MFDGVKNNDLKQIEDYKYLADIITWSYSNVISYAYNEVYENTFLALGKESYESMYGKDTFVPGYIDIVFPLSFFYVDGKIVNFEIGDYSSKLTYVMEKYNKEVTNNE